MRPVSACDVAVLLDMHRLNSSAQTDLWYDSQYDLDDLLEGWDNILTVSDTPFEHPHNDRDTPP